MAKKRKFAPIPIDLGLLFQKPCPGPELVVLALKMVDLELALLELEVKVIRVMASLIRYEFG